MCLAIGCASAQTDKPVEISWAAKPTGVSILTLVVQGLC